LISFENVNLNYSEGTPFAQSALKGVSFNILEGELVGVIGHTGSGKSTLAQLMCSLLVPSSGDILVGGMNTKDKKQVKKIRSQVSMVFQYPEHQIFEETVMQEIAFGPKNLEREVQEVEEDVRWAMEVMELPIEMGDKSPFDLSGGQKRKVAIASIVAMKPKILILDEPTAGLDPGGRRKLLELIRFLHKKLNMGIIIISHSMEDVAQVANRVLVLNKGKIFMDGTVPEVYSRAEELKSINLDIPEATHLTKMLEVKECYTVQEAVVAIREDMPC